MVTACPTFMNTTVGIAAVATRVNAWEAFWMVVTSLSCVNAQTGHEHAIQNKNATNIKGTCRMFAFLSAMQPFHCIDLWETRCWLARVSTSRPINLQLR